MDNKLFSSIISDYYVRRYELISEMFGGLNVRIHAECSTNTDGINNDYYALSLYVSAGELSNRDCILEVSFGSKQMSQEEINAEIDDWVAFTVNDVFFALDLEAYLKKEQIWEDFLDDEATREAEEAE